MKVIANLDSGLPYNIYGQYPKRKSLPVAFSVEKNGMKFWNSVTLVTHIYRVFTIIWGSFDALVTKLPENLKRLAVE